MKRLIVTLGLAACLIGFPSYANNKPVPDVLESFYHTFRGAQSVSWTEVDGILRIGFTVDGQQHFAYYADSELIVVAKEIKAEVLPLSLQNGLTKYSGYTITQIYELEKNNTKEYCVVIDNASSHITLKGKNKWSVFIDEKK
jgi:hypothetical protein